MELEIIGLTKKYNDNTALDNFTGKFSYGIYGILGPNGSGKSTLFNLLTDNLVPTAGKILLDGKGILEMGGEYRARLGYMPQRQGFYEDFTAKMFLKYFCSLKGIKPKDKYVEQILENVNLLDVKNSKISSLSGGMKQRLLFAQAILNDPEILILDEPTAGLDPKERINFRNMLASLSKNKIILIATHIVSDIESIADNVVLLKKGKILIRDSPENLMNSIQNKVYEIRGSKDELLSKRSETGMGNIIHDQSGIALRIVTDEPYENCIPVENNISLEDVYLYYFEYLK